MKARIRSSPPLVAIEVAVRDLGSRPGDLANIIFMDSEIISAVLGGYLGV
ncbi:hypothetical protein GCM10009828_058450 [Actinoplanes couchii]